MNAAAAAATHRGPPLTAPAAALPTTSRSVLPSTPQQPFKETANTTRVDDGDLLAGQFREMTLHNAEASHDPTRPVEPKATHPDHAIQHAASACQALSAPSGVVPLSLSSMDASAVPSPPVTPTRNQLQSPPSDQRQEHTPQKLEEECKALREKIAELESERGRLRFELLMTSRDYLDAMRKLGEARRSLIQANEAHNTYKNSATSIVKVAWEQIQWSQNFCLDIYKAAMKTEEVLLSQINSLANYPLEPVASIRHHSEKAISFKGFKTLAVFSKAGVKAIEECDVSCLTLEEWPKAGCLIDQGVLHRTSFVYDLLVTEKLPILSVGSGNCSFERAICRMRNERFGDIGSIRASHLHPVETVSPLELPDPPVLGLDAKNFKQFMLDSLKPSDSTAKPPFFGSDLVKLPLDSSLLFNCPWDGWNTSNLLIQFMGSAHSVLQQGKYVFLGITESGYQDFKYFNSYDICGLARAVLGSFKLICVDTGFHDLVWENGYQHHSDIPGIDIDRLLRGTLIMLCFQKI
ncbi:hypothetical protein DFJ73DRAFT_845915 [Zopfochytrium polystomum]|nr:hypothetical protein DFJ73DRAFT_845915 [Zopfochytrium polystomum]